MEPNVNEQIERLMQLVQVIQQADMSRFMSDYNHYRAMYHTSNWEKPVARTKRDIERLLNNVQ